MTLDVYAGLLDDELDDVADRMGEAADAATTDGDASTEQGPGYQPAADDEGRDDA